VAGAAHGNMYLLIFGLIISIPLIAWSSQLVLKLIDRFPFIIFGGGALLGYVAGEMLVGEAMFANLVETNHYLHYLIPVCGAVAVLAIGQWLATRQTREPEVIDLLDETVKPK
jgi:predicted tellurium resistance membrane protein TerC